MQLLLVPPLSLPVHPTLQRHEIPTPHLPSPDELRHPQAFLRARRALAKVGLAPPSLIAFDSALWWQVIVRSVEWNLEDEAVTVTLIDGSEERWDLASDDDEDVSLSQELVDEALSALEGGAGERADDVEMTDGTRQGRVSSWAPPTVLGRLRDFCLELRSAYEDLSIAQDLDELAPEMGSAEDWAILQKLSADPRKAIPFAWSDAQSLYAYAMEGVESDGDSSNADEDPDGASRRRRQPSQTASDDVDEDVPLKFHGQFQPRYRARRTKASLVAGGNGQPHDFLSTIHLLSRIRAFLADLFARVIIPRLRQAMPPTYPSWAATGAIGWCRREAVRLGGEVAQLLLELLDDDGDAFDADSESEHSQTADILVVGEDNEYALGAPLFGGPGSMAPMTSSDGLDGLGGVYDDLAEWRAEEKRVQRLSQNVLVSMQDDFEMRRWCEGALERARDLAQRDWIPDGVAPNWIAPVRAREISRARDGDESDLDVPPSRRAFRVPLSLRPRTTSDAASPPTSPPPEMDSPKPRKSVHWADSKATDSDDASTDTDSDDDLDVAARRYATEFFYPEDPLEEKFLPPRLPKDLVRQSATRGIEMEEHREKVHALLNKINGLQHKIADLQDFVLEETDRWEQHLEEDRKPKAASPPAPSGLRSSGPSSASPPLPKLRHKPVPLKTQPLRKQAADRALSLTLDSALSDLTGPDRLEPVRHAKLPNVRVRSAAPRRKQKLNLEAYLKVLAMSRGLHPDSPGSGGRGPSKKKRKRAQQHGGSGAALKGQSEGASPRKRRRKGKSVRREGAIADLFGSLASSSAQDVFGSASSTGSATGATPGAEASQDARRLTVVELSNRRRDALGAVSGRAPLAWAEDEHDDDDETADEDADGVDLELADPLLSEAGMYHDEESDTDEDEAGDLEPVEIAARTLGVAEGDDGPHSSLDSRPDSPFHDVYEAPTRPGSPTKPPSSPSPAPAPSLVRTLSTVLPLSAERGSVPATSTPRAAPCTPPVQSHVLAPLPRRPTTSLLSQAASSSPSWHLPPSSSPSPPRGRSAAIETSASTSAGLAHRVRERHACLAEPPVQVEPPLSLDWPSTPAQEEEAAEEKQEKGAQRGVGAEDDRLA